MERDRGVELPYKQAWRALNRSRKSLGREGAAGEGEEGEGEREGDTTMGGLSGEGETSQMGYTGLDGALDPRLAGPEDANMTTLSQLRALAQHRLPSYSTATTTTTTTHPNALTAPTRYTLTFFVPPTHLSACRTAVFSAGAGRIGNYADVSFELEGRSQFMPVECASPADGQVGQLNVVEEVRVEVMCGSEEVAREAIRRLREAHPYEEVVCWARKVEDL